MKIAVNTDVATALSKLNLAFQSRHRSKPKPRAMYHYTTAAGAAGIIQSNEFWLSDAFNTNDQTEIRHGISLFKNLIKKTPVFGKGSKRIEILEKILRAMKDAHVPRIFFTSFSTNENDINSFRLYGDETRGVMLGLPPQCLDQTLRAYDSTGRTTRSCVLAPIIYDDEKKKEEVSFYIDAFGGLFSTLYDSKKLTEGNQWYCMMNFLGQVYQAIASFKVTDWKAEHEIRLFVTLLTKKVDPEVANDGLRRPFIRQHPKTKKELEYLKSFIPMQQHSIPEVLDLDPARPSLHGLTLPFNSCILGAAHSDKQFETDFSRRYPTVKIERSKALYTVF